MEVIEKPATELSLPERAAKALGSSDLEANLVALAKKYADIVAVKDKTDRAQVHGAAMTLKNNRTAIKSAGKAAREDAASFQKAVITEENRLVAIIEPEEIRLLALRDEFDAAEEAAKQAKITSERKRIDGIKAAIDAIRNIPLAMVGKSSAEISQCIFGLAARPDYSDMEEFEAEAISVRLQVIDQLAKAETATRAIEGEAESRRNEAARIAAEQAETARQQKEKQAELDRATAAHSARMAEEERIATLARQKLDAKAAEARRIADAELASQRAEMAKQQAIIDAQLREQEAATAKEEARRNSESKAAADAEAKRLQDIADEQERQDKAARQERTRIESAQHVERVHADIVANMVANGFHTSDADTLIDLICAGKVPHVTINY